MVYYEKNPFAFLHEVLKYTFLGTGVLTHPVVDLCMFVKSDVPGDKGFLRASQSDAKDPNNVPDIEIMTVSLIRSTIFKFTHVNADLS